MPGSDMPGTMSSSREVAASSLRNMVSDISEEMKKVMTAFERDMVELKQNVRYLIDGRLQKLRCSLPLDQGRQVIHIVRHIGIASKKWQL